MKPIIFSTPMVKAILEGKKTQTRRVIDKDISNKFDIENDGKTVIAWIHPDTGDHFEPTYPAKYKVGDVLWVRETWCKVPWTYSNDLGVPDESYKYFYRADGEMNEQHDLHSDYDKWRPSIHMPREAARLFLKVTGVRVERINEITGRDVLAEGIDNVYTNPKMGERWENAQIMVFEDLWDSLNAKRGYAFRDNCWVWVYEFERVMG